MQPKTWVVWVAACHVNMGVRRFELDLVTSIFTVSWTVTWTDSYSGHCYLSYQSSTSTSDLENTNYVRMREIKRERAG